MRACVDGWWWCFGHDSDDDVFVHATARMHRIMEPTDRQLTSVRRALCPSHQLHRRRRGVNIHVLKPGTWKTPAGAVKHGPGERDETKPQDPMSTFTYTRYEGHVENVQIFR